MIELDQFPVEMRERIQKDIEERGEWLVSHSLYLAPLWKMIDDLQPTDTDICWLATTIHMVSFFSTKDPAPIHFVVAREILKEKGCDDDKAVDILARELVNYCCAFKEKIFEVYSHKEGSIACLPIYQDGGLLIPERTHMPNFICHRDGCNSFDLSFCEFLETIGERGKEASKAIIEDSFKRHQLFKESKYSPELRPQSWNLWIPEKQENKLTTVFSPYLSILADAVWVDHLQIKYEKAKKQLPALTQSVSKPVSRILSSRALIDPAKGTVAYEGKIVADIPTIDAKLMPIVTKGSQNLNTIYHHKLLRFECKSGFEKWAQGSADPRVLRFDGGETEIAEKLGIKYKEAPTTIRALLHAQAYMNFHFDDGSYGNLIVLRQFKSRKTNREEGVEIIMGTQLMPGYTFNTDKRTRLLVPVPELPPFTSSSNYHAGQSLLQMLIMEEFTNKSIDLATFGSIEIKDETWKSFQKQSGLPDSVFKSVITRWLSDGDDGGRFLIRTDGDRYTLGEGYSKELKFLVYQGLHRKDQQARGLSSVKKRKRST